MNPFQAGCRTAVLAALACVLATPTAHAAAEGQPTDEVVEPATEGVLLGRFYVRDIRGAEGVKIRISFALYASVARETADEFRARLSKLDARVRDEVLTVVRLSRLSDFQQPELERFRRRILLRLRRTTPALAIDGLLIGEFEMFVDQR